MEFKKSPKLVRKTLAVSLPARDTPASPKASEPVKMFPPKKPTTSRIRTLVFTKKAGAISGVIILAIVAYCVFQANTGASDPNKIILDPGYQTILPSGKSIKDLGGWRRISPSEKDPVYAYTDTIDNVSVSVSQQPLPKTFEPNIKEHVADLAKKFNATTEIDVDDATAYIGTSAKGPQSVIFTKKGLLILIKSQRKITTTSWQHYINSLNTDRY